jgi:hypothetical protein
MSNPISIFLAGFSSVIFASTSYGVTKKPSMATGISYLSSRTGSRKSRTDGHSSLYEHLITPVAGSSGDVLGIRIWCLASACCNE